MHIAFIDIAQAYTADRPDKNEPFGGTNTAVCFLARALVSAGVTCTIFNKIPQPQTAHSITSLPLERLIEERSNPAYTAFIFCGRWVEWLVDLVREKTSVPLIAWMHESTFNPEFVPPLKSFDGSVFVSEWQARINQPHVPHHWRQAIIRNAMNPVFATMFTDASYILAAKTKPPILLYAGSTPRGVLYLPAILDVLRAKRSDFSVEIYCNCAPTNDDALNAACLEKMRNLPNVTHVGMVGQTDLAQRMKRASILLSPNPWPETSCITLIEALAAGMQAVTTNRAVLPETAAGYAVHVPVDDADHPSRFDMPVPVEMFVDAVCYTLNRQSDELEKNLRKQVDYFNTYYQWVQRTAPWIDYIRSFGN
jgi:glycosyltransferase involved in cell wall biosynthesis